MFITRRESSLIRQPSLCQASSLSTHLSTIGSTQVPLPMRSLQASIFYPSHSSPSINTWSAPSDGISSGRYRKSSLRLPMSAWHSIACKITSWLTPGTCWMLYTLTNYPARLSSLPSSNTFQEKTSAMPCMWVLGSKASHPSTQASSSTTCQAWPGANGSTPSFLNTTSTKSFMCTATQMP